MLRTATSRQLWGGLFLQAMILMPAVLLGACTGQIENQGGDRQDTVLTGDSIDDSDTSQTDSSEDTVGDTNPDITDPDILNQDTSSDNGTDTGTDNGTDTGTDTGEPDTSQDMGCEPQCAGKMCGPDGCGGSCGNCGNGTSCNQGTGQCVDVMECGNNTQDPGELCDGDCPTSCSPPNSCTNSTLVGSAANCDARCEESPVSSCVDNDGCCPSNCDFNNDNDCSLDCTNLSSWPQSWADAEDDALAQMNAERAAGTDCPSGTKSPVASITMNDELRIAARCHSQDMANNNFFSHTGSDGSRFWDRTADAGYTGTPRYENIAGGNSGGVPTIGQWMSSTQGHCDAIMDGTVTEVGLGYIPGASECWGHCWTAVFGQ